MVVAHQEGTESVSDGNRIHSRTTPTKLLRLRLVWNNSAEQNFGGFFFFRFHSVFKSFGGVESAGSVHRHFPSATRNRQMMRTTPDAPIVVSGGSDPRAFFFFFSFQLKPSVDLIKRKNKKTIVELTSRRHTLEERGGKQVEEQKSSRRIRRTTRRKPRDHQELNEPQQQQRQPRF